MIKTHRPSRFLRHSAEHKPWPGIAIHLTGDLIQNPIGFLVGLSKSRFAAGDLDQPAKAAHLFPVRGIPAKMAHDDSLAETVLEERRRLTSLVIESRLAVRVIAI